MKTQHSQQICYVAWGADYIRMAARSARSVKHYTPNIHVIAHLNESPDTADLGVFDQLSIDVISNDVISLKQQKPKALITSQAEYSIYLDADTVVATNLQEIFDALNSCDIATVLDEAPCNIEFFRHISSNPELPTFPASEPLLNAGVIAIRRSEKTLRFLQNWHDAIAREAAQINVHRDQWTFRRLLYQSDLKLRILPPGFNVAIWGPLGLNGPVRILHTQDKPSYSVPQLLAFLNSWTGRRVFTPHDGKMLEEISQCDVRFKFLRDEYDKVYRDNPRMTLGQHFRDIFPSLVRSMRYRLFK